MTYLRFYLYKLGKINNSGFTLSVTALKTKIRELGDRLSGGEKQRTGFTIMVLPECFF